MNICRDVPSVASAAAASISSSTASASTSGQLRQTPGQHRGHQHDESESLELFQATSANFKHHTVQASLDVLNWDFSLQIFPVTTLYKHAETGQLEAASFNPLSDNIRGADWLLVFACSLHADHVSAASDSCAHTCHT